jgi:hypothetical protein
MEQYPLFKQEHQEVEDPHFASYLSFTDQLVNQVQFHSNAKREIPLTFYPIAKNIRIPASYMAINVLNQTASFLENQPRVGEETFWREHKKMGEWFPWLWARDRIPGNYTNKEGWALYFDSFTEQAKPILSFAEQAKPILSFTEQAKPILSFAEQAKPITETIDTVQPPPELLLFFTYLSCMKYVFQLNEVYRLKMDEYREQMKWPQGKILAVQIRRGETCTKDGSITDRPFYHLTKYIEEIEKVIHSYEYIYVSTDSDEEINELKRQRPDWKILYLPIDRSQFFRMNEKPVDLEVFCCLETSRIPFIVDSGLADLYFISQCQGYISTISVSEFSRCGWFLQIATQGKITTYINMNDEPLNMENRDKLLLL